MISGLTISGYVCDQSWPFYSAVGLVGAHLTQQIYSLNINDPSDCARKFISNHQVGLIIFLGIVIGTYLKSEQDVQNSTKSPAAPAAPAFLKMSKEKLNVS